MKKYDYIYYCQNKRGINVPVSVGSTSDLQLVLWLSRQEKEAIIPKEWASNELFIRIDGESFMVQDRV